MNLYRSISIAEWKDFQQHNEFRKARNTLEGKQFFKSETAAREYKRKADLRGFFPPYAVLSSVEVDEECLNKIPFEQGILDDFEAITIEEQDLKAFNKCIKFVLQHDF